MSSKDSVSSKDEKLAVDPEAKDREPAYVLPEIQDGKKLDVSLALPGMTGDFEELDEAEARRVKRKVDLRLLPLLFTLYMLQYLDKNAIGAVTVLGFLADNKLTGTQFNTLGSMFYVGMLVSQWPHSFCLQRFPVAKYLAVNIFLWSLFVAMHCVARSFGSLIVLRILLGFSEGCITPGLMLITSMFYTRTEIGERIGWTFQCNGIASIVSAFIAFGVYHAPAHTPATPQKVAQWQWFMIIISLLTFVVGVIFVILFPDSPATAKFLTDNEKVVVVKRMKVNQTGVETKTWKWYQFWEALRDPKAWFFFWFAVVVNMISGVGIQYSLIIKDFGFNIMQTTLLNIPLGCSQIIGVTTAVYVLRKCPNSRWLITICAYTPSIIGVGILLGEKSNRNAWMFGFSIIQLGVIPAVVMSLSWITTTVSGHTKKVTMNGIWLVGYSVGQIVAPQFWLDKYKPRNRVPWSIIMASFVVQQIIVLGLRYYLISQNKLRDRLQKEAEESGKDMSAFDEYAYMEIPDSNAPNGVRREKVEKRFLDLTDGENLNFRYVL